jgi:predicted  nucleic acid-binding Zn-ribbon protein
MTRNMSDENEETDTKEFLNWAEEMAESEGVSTEEILDQVVSAYWVYTELQRTLNSVTNTRLPRNQATDTSADIDESSDQQQQPSSEGTQEPASRKERVSEDSSTQNSGFRTMSDERSQKELWQRLYDLSDKIDQHRQSQTERWMRLRDRVDDIEQEVKTVDNQNQNQAQAPDRPSGNTMRVNNIQSDIDQLKEEIDHLQDSHEELLELHQEFETRIEDFERSQEAIQSRIDTEFDSIESAFETAMNQQEEIQTRHSKLTNQIENNSETIESIADTKATLETIKQTALEEGIKEAKCDYCGQNIQISMLASPECPFCETPLNDVSPGGWNPLDSNVLTGAPRDLSSDDSENLNSLLDENVTNGGLSN